MIGIQVTAFFLAYCTKKGAVQAFTSHCPFLPRTNLPWYNVMSYPPPSPPKANRIMDRMASNDDHCDCSDPSCVMEEWSDRRDILQKFLSSVPTVAAAGTLFLAKNPPVFALDAPENASSSNDTSSKAPKKSLGEEYRQGTAALANMDSKAPAPESAYVKLPSGVIYADLRPGTGEEVLEGSRVNLQWVLRKSNGYFVDSSEVQNGVPFIFTVGDKKAAIEGLDEGIRGMRQGGTRRILIPPSLAYVQGLEDGLPGPLPAGYGPRQQMRRVQTLRKDVPGEYIFLEVLVTRVR